MNNPFRHGKQQRIFHSARGHLIVIPSQILEYFPGNSKLQQNIRRFLFCIYEYFMDYYYLPQDRPSTFSFLDWHNDNFSCVNFSYRMFNIQNSTNHCYYQYHCVNFGWLSDFVVIYSQFAFQPKISKTFIICNGMQVNGMNCRRDKNRHIFMRA